MKIKSKKLKIFLSRKISVIAAIGLVLMLFAAFAGPFLTSHDPNEMDFNNRFGSISRENWLGTDWSGRDMFTRIIHGGQVSIGLALFGVSIGVSFGLIFGLISGYYGGVTDALISRFIDFLMAVPAFMIAIISLALLGPGGINTGIAVGVSTIPLFMRMTRSQVIAIKDSDYVKSCRIIGVSDSRIIVTHIMPGIWPLIAVTFTLQLGTALLSTAALSFLGIGVSPPTPEWGSLLSSGRVNMLAFPLGIMAPGIAIMLFVMCTSLVGDGLRDALDPKSVE
ncbi:MAG: ABC transporter permease [Defluviitaleaceae bacterium]|nr:ABC transporter permease [Defluviitaleaceae bacterium]